MKIFIFIFLRFFDPASIPTRPTDSQLKSTTRTNCCIHTVYLLEMG